MANRRAQPRRPGTPGRRFALVAAAALLALGVPGAKPAAAQQVVNGCQIAPRGQCRNADLTGTSLREAELAKANLQGASLIRADLRGADLQGANLMQTTLFQTNLSGANLQGALLVGAKLGWANLTEANLSGAIWSNGHTCAPGSIGTCN
jgi:Pentapeptide repeats (8 copies)